MDYTLLTHRKDKMVTWSTATSLLKRQLLACSSITAEEEDELATDLEQWAWEDGTGNLIPGPLSSTPCSL